MLDPATLLLALSVLLITGLGGYFTWKAQVARLAAWAEFAHRHGMSAEGLRINGSYEGLPLTVETQARGSGRSRHTVAVLRLSLCDALPPGFSLEREGLGDKVLRFFGKRDPEIGDEQFDQLFDLENLSSAMAAVLRDKRVQTHLYEMVNAYQDFHIRDGWIHAERRRVPASTEALEEFTGPALMLAHTLEQAIRRSSGETPS